MRAVAALATGVSAQPGWNFGNWWQRPERTWLVNPDDDRYPLSDLEYIAPFFAMALREAVEDAKRSVVDSHADVDARRISCSNGVNWRQGASGGNGFCFEAMSKPHLDATADLVNRELGSFWNEIAAVQSDMPDGKFTYVTEQTNDGVRRLQGDKLIENEENVVAVDAFENVLADRYLSAGIVREYRGSSLHKGLMSLDRKFKQALVQRFYKSDSLPMVFHPDLAQYWLDRSWYEDDQSRRDWSMWSADDVERVKYLHQFINEFDGSLAHDARDLFDKCNCDSQEWLDAKTFWFGAGDFGQTCGYAFALVLLILTMLAVILYTYFSTARSRPL